jgi:hypothetical protein
MRRLAGRGSHSAASLRLATGVAGLLLLAATIVDLQVNAAFAGPAFTMADSLVCTIERSTSPDDVGKKIVLSGLTTEAPRAVFDNYIRSAMVRLFESESTLVIQLVAKVSGSVDTIVIDKLSGRFAHTAAGAFPAELHAVSETGVCRPE